MSGCDLSLDRLGGQVGVEDVHDAFELAIRLLPVDGDPLGLVRSGFAGGVRSGGLTCSVGDAEVATARNDDAGNFTGDDKVFCANSLIWPARMASFPDSIGAFARSFFAPSA